LCNLRRLQEGGHQVIGLAGGATGMIGDPGGKSEERNLLDSDTLAMNLAGIKAQIQGFLLPGAEFVDNATWTQPMSILDFLRDVGKHFTINQMIGKEMVRNRIQNPDEAISYTEFSYMLLQALDEATSVRPEKREAQRALAFEVTALVHGRDEAERAAHASGVLFSEEIVSLDEQTLMDVFAEAPSTVLPREPVPLVDVLVTSG